MQDDMLQFSSTWSFYFNWLPLCYHIWMTCCSTVFSCCFCCLKGFSVMMQQRYYCTMKPVISSGFHYKTLPLHWAKRTYTAVKVHLFWTITHPCCDKHPRDQQKQSIQSGKDNKIWVCYSEFPELTPVCICIYPETGCHITWYTGVCVCFSLVGGFR